MASSSATATETKNVINLKGSAKLIQEFMEYSINMILYQREVYHDDEFDKVQRYGRPVYLTNNEQLKKYLDGVLSGMKESIEADECKKVVLVIISCETEEPIEKWEFAIESEPGDEDKENTTIKKETTTTTDPSKRTATRELKQIQNVMMKIMKQICGTVTYLPCRDSNAELTFNILLYTKKRGQEIMNNWQESHSHELYDGGDGEEVQVLNFDDLSTGVNTVKSKVCYKVQNM